MLNDKLAQEKNGKADDDADGDGNGSSPPPDSSPGAKGRGSGETRQNTPPKGRSACKHDLLRAQIQERPETSFPMKTSPDFF